MAHQPGHHEVSIRLDRGLPSASYEYVDVTFGSADADQDIRHSLRPLNPEDVEYLLVRSDRATALYHDQSGTRTPWSAGRITLRSSAASAVTRILLFTKRGTS
jgi:hypothetical protein